MKKGPPPLVAVRRAAPPRRGQVWSLFCRRRGPGPGGVYPRLERRRCDVLGGLFAAQGVDFIAQCLRDTGGPLDERGAIEFRLGGVAFIAGGVQFVLEGVEFSLELRISSTCHAASMHIKHLICQ